MNTRNALLMMLALVFTMVLTSDSLQAQGDCPCPYFLKNNTDGAVTFTVNIGDQSRSVTVPGNTERRICLDADPCPEISSINIGDQFCFAGHVCKINGLCYSVATNGVTINGGGSCD